MATTRKSTEVDEQATTITDVQMAKPFGQMLRAMAQDATMEADSAAFAGDDDVSINAMLTAETDEEIWEADERGPLGFRDLAGCEIAILDVQVKYSRSNVNAQGEEIRSAFVAPDGRKMYLLCTCVRIGETGDESKRIKLPEIGEEFQANTSARYLVPKIWAFYVRGRIDHSTGASLECRVKATDLGGDQAVVKLRPIPRRPTTVNA